MKVHTRFQDKVTFISMSIVIIVCFVTSVITMIVLYGHNYIFWQNATPCYIDNSFECLSNLLLKESSLSGNILLSISLLGSLNGIVASLAFIILYKFEKYE